ncbi:MAG: DUF2508 family protein [Christensenellales bacterium]|jgi:hypothetical protein
MLKWFFETVEEKSAEQIEKERLISEVREALDEWKAAQSYFHYVSEPELVDCAIFNIEAARRRYMYLAGKLREMGDGREGINTG